MSHKEAAGVQRVPSAAFPAETLPAISIRAGMTLSYRDVAVVGILPSGPTALPDADGFNTVSYRKKTFINTPPAEISAVNKVKPCRQPLTGVSSYPCLSSRNLKGLRHCLSLGLAPRLRLMTYTRH
jgi:hypothetical protein